MASRAVLTRWATDVCGTSVGKSLPLEKQCANGVIYCKLLDSVRPGSINLTRVNNDADGVRTQQGAKLFGTAHAFPQVSGNPSRAPSLLSCATCVGSESTAKLQAASGSP